MQTQERIHNIPIRKITEYQVFSECIEFYLGQQRTVSRNCATPLGAQKGLEPIFDILEQKIQILQKKLHEARYGEDAEEEKRRDKHGQDQD